MRSQGPRGSNPGSPRAGPRFEHSGQAIWRYPQRHSGVPKNHWSRITGGTESPGPTLFPRLQFPGPTLRHRGAHLLVTLVPESSIPLLDSSLVAASCSWVRVPLALQEPVLTSLSVTSDTRHPGRRGSRPGSLCAGPKVRAFRAGDPSLPPTTQWGSGEPLEPNYRRYRVTWPYLVSEAAVPRPDTQTPYGPPPGVACTGVRPSVARLLLVPASSSCSRERGHVHSPGARLGLVAILFFR